MSHPAVDQHITFLYTDDLSTSTLFYEDVLGLKLWRDQGTCRIYAVTPDSYLGICQTGAAARGKITGGQQDNIILTLVTEQVDTWYRYLQERGVHFEKPPEHNPRYNIYHCFLRDPNGYLIEIQRFLD
jgi:catechol 2,3-dioxygenase-like lactoylglutathione lyase family enzyme